MPNFAAVELKPFLPSKDFALSKQFYEELGFAVEPLAEDLACITHGKARFLLHDSYAKAFADNLQLHLLVKDIDSWWARASRIVPNYGMPLGPIGTQSWGMRDFVFLDPCGVLWRIGEEIPSS